MSDYIPWDVITEIFARFPLRTLSKLVFESRKLYNLIKNLSFYKFYLTLHHKDASDLLIVRRCAINPGLVEGTMLVEELYSLYRDNGIVCANYKDLVLPFQKSEDGMYRMVGTSNGLVCLSDDYLKLHSYEAILWNPTINKFIEVPRLPVTSVLYYSNSGLFQSVLGFGYEPRGGDYKLIKAVDYRAYVDGSDFEVYLFNATNRSWKNLTTSIIEFPYLMANNPKCVLYNGCLHWALETFYSETKELVSFDLYEEDFQYVGFPKTFPLKDLVENIEFGVNCFDIAVIDGWFCVVECYATRYAIWRMNTYGVNSSWAKFISVVYPLEIENFVGFGCNGSQIVSIGERLYAFDPQNLGLRELRIDYPYTVFSTNSFYIGSYVESLGLYIG